MGEKDDEMGLRLSLSLGSCGQNANNQQQQQSPLKLMMNLMQKPPQSVLNQRVSLNNLFHFHDLSSETRSFLRGVDMNSAPPYPPVAAAVTCDDESGGASSPNSTVSSISGKRSEREPIGDENEGGERKSCSRGGESDEDDVGGFGGDGDGDSSRKKLRLSKEQSVVLEETFKEHSTLNPRQKQALAQKLNLTPRQVEVWFQNRRARTKLKQTEVDCEYLKRCCETLTEENRRLQKEVQELRALKLSPQFYMHMNPPTTLTMCPSCERVAVSSASSSSSSVTAPPAPAAVNCNPLGPNIQRQIPINPWAAMPIQHRPFEGPTPRP